MQSNEEYLDSLLASVSNASVDNTKAADTNEDKPKREILSEDELELSPEDAQALQSIIDDIEDYSLEEGNETDIKETQQETDKEETPQQTDAEKAMSKEDVDEIPLNTDVDEIPLNTDVDEIPSNTDVDEMPLNTDVEEIPHVMDGEKIPQKADNETVQPIDDSMDEIMQMLGLNQSEENKEENEENIEELLKQAELQGKSERIGQKEDYESKELDEILGSLKSEDDDLAEIGDIFTKSENNELLDADMMSVFDGLKEEDSSQGMFDQDIPVVESPEPVEEPEEEQKEEKKKKKEKKKKEKKSKEKPERTEEEEMAQLLDEADPSLKKDKKGKGKKKAGGSAKDTNAALEEELEQEDKANEKKLAKAKQKKEKAAARAEKRKAAKENRDQKYAYLDQGHKISNKGIVAVFAICFSLMTVLLVLVFFIPAKINLKHARDAFYAQDYKTVVTRLCGKKLNNSDELLYEKAVLFYSITVHMDDYEVYYRKNDNLRALDALMQGAKACESAESLAKNYGMDEERCYFRDQINENLSLSFNLDASIIEKLMTLDPLDYTNAVEQIAGGMDISQIPELTPPKEETPAAKEEQPDKMEDLLPEEQELLQPGTGEGEVIYSDVVENGEVNMVP